MKRGALVVAATLAAWLLRGAAAAYDPLTTERLTGDWGGARSALDARGLDVQLVYAGDVANVHGGITQTTEYLDNVDLTLTVRFAELTGYDLGTVFLYGLSNQGGDPSAAVGDVQGVDNIEAPDGVQLYEAWWQKAAFGNRVSLLLGLYDVNAEFDVIASAALFLNGSFGTGPEFSQSGRNGPSIFPNTGLALRLKSEPLPNLSLQAAVVDGVPGDDATSLGSKFSLDGDQGALIIGEAAYVWGAQEELDEIPLLRVQRRRVGRGWGEIPYSAKVAFGVWGYTEPLPTSDDPAGTDRKAGHPGVYLLGEYDASALDPFDARGVALFARLGVADPQVQPIAGYAGAGVSYLGLLPGRPQDRAGFGIAAAEVSSDFQTAPGGPGYEIDLEWTYRAALLPWLALQPDVQWVINPSGAAGRADAVVLALRTEITF